MFKHMTKCDILSVPFQKTFSLLVPTLSSVFFFIALLLCIVWMALREVFIGRKTCKNTVKSQNFCLFVVSSSSTKNYKWLLMHIQASFRHSLLQADISAFLPFKNTLFIVLYESLIFMHLLLLRRTHMRFKAQTIFYIFFCLAQWKMSENKSGYPFIQLLIL